MSEVTRIRGRFGLALSLPMLVVLATLAAGCHSPQTQSVGLQTVRPGVPLAEQRVTLNGVWDFEPQQEYKPPTAFTTNIYVPSFWNHPWTFGYPPEWGSLPAGWFRRTVDIPKDWQGQRIALRFDAIHMTGQVFFNGRHVANQWDPINPLTVDVTPYVKWGEPNEIRVGVREAIAESNDLITPVDPAKVGANFQPGGTRDSKARALVPYGLYFSPDLRQNGLAQDVWLIRTAPVYVQNVFVQTSVRKHEIVADYEIRNSSDRPAKVNVRARVTPWKDKKTVLDFPPAGLTIAPGEVGKVHLARPWADAELWDPDHPYLYLLHTTLTESGGAWAGTSQQRFGFREIWREGRNMYLNGRRINLHGDTLILAGVNDLYEERAFRTMCDLYKRLNINIVRFHGHSVALSMYDAFDEVGIMAVAESGLHGSCGDQALEDERFWDNAREHLRNMVREERNHPCITVWSVENEIGAFLQGSEKLGWSRLSDLTRVVKENDPTRLAWHEGFAYPANTVYDRFAPVANDAQSLHYPHGETWPIYYNFPEANYWAKTVLERPWGFGGLPMVLGEYAGVPMDNGWNIQGRQYKPLQQGPLIGTMQKKRPDGSMIWDWTVYWESLGYSLRGNRYAGTALTSPFTIAEHYLLQSGGRYEDINVLNRKFDWATPGIKFPNVLHDRYPLLDVEPRARPPYKWMDMIVPVAQAYHPLLSFPKQHNTRFWGGAKITLDFITFNDLYRPEKQALAVTLADASGRALDKFDAPVDIPVGEHREIAVSLKLPNVSAVTPAKLLVRHYTPGGRAYEETIPVTLYPPVPVATVCLYDPTGQTGDKLQQAGLKVQTVPSLENLSPQLPNLVIGEEALALTIPSDIANIRKFLQQGGRVVVLAHSDANFYGVLKEWAALEDDVSVWPYEPQRGPIPTTVAHLTGQADPATASLQNTDVRFWAKDHAVAVFGLKLKTDPAITSLVMCNRPLLDDNRSLLARIDVGQGHLYLCQMLLADNLRDEPAARLILAGILSSAR